MNQRATIGPTRERIQRAREEGASVVQIPTEDAGISVWYLDGCTKLARYLRRREIEQRHYDAGCRLCQDWTIAGLQPRVVAPYSDLVAAGSVSALHLPDSRLAAYTRYQRAMTAIGPIAANEVESVCLFDNAVGRTGLEILRRGLKILADHYGLPA